MRLDVPLLSFLYIVSYPTCCLSTAQQPNGGRLVPRKGRDPLSFSWSFASVSGHALPTDNTSSTIQKLSSSAPGKFSVSVASITFTNSLLSASSNLNPNTKPSSPSNGIGRLSSALAVTTIPRSGSAASQPTFQATERVALSWWNSRFGSLYPTQPSNTVLSITIESAKSSPSAATVTATDHDFYEGQSPPYPTATITSSGLIGSVLPATRPNCGASVTTKSSRPSKTYNRGACQLTTFSDPPKPTSCNGKGRDVVTWTACSCPDNIAWLRQDTDDSKACTTYDGKQGDISSVSLYTCTESSTIPIACRPPAATALQNSAGLPFHISPTFPKTCTLSSITWSSVRAAKSGQMLLEPDQIEWKLAKSWNFSASGGGRISKMSVNDGPDTSPSGPVTHNDSPTQNADGSWTLLPKEGSVTRPIFAYLDGRGTTDDGNFPFTVTAVIPCDKPVPQECTTQDHQLTVDQWNAFSTDEFLNQTLTNWTRVSSSKQDFWPWFVKEYVGDGFATSCTVDQDGGCGPLTQSCQDMIKTPYLRQAYLVMAAMMQVSRFLHFAYASFGQAEKDLASYIPTWDLAFSVPSKQSSWKTIIAVFASITGMLSVIAFFAAPFLAGTAAFATNIAGASIFGLSAALNGAVNFANAAGIESAEPMFQTYATSVDSMKQFIELNQWDLIDLHNAYFLNATNLTSLLRGGIFVGGQLISQVVDTKNIPQTADSSLSGKIKGAANWYDKFTILNLLNGAWTSAGMYVVYVAYGPTKWFGRQTVNFKQEDCMGDRFWKRGRYNDSMAFCCDCAQQNPGMLVFMNSGWKFGDPDQFKPKNFFDVQGYSIIDYHFNYRDVLTSAFKSYDQHGYKYNITHETTREAIATGNFNLLKSWTSLVPTDPGVFNIPVCRIFDLAYVPGCTYVGGDEFVRCFTQPKTCLDDAANYTDGKGKAHFFRDNVVKDVPTSLAYTQPMEDFLQGAP